ncbi:MAG: hypothetical protein KA166_09975, partial [Saprospiraceae bacterium]|nr:hypothetical protein [Saprospiraceae bacterium]
TGGIIKNSSGIYVLKDNNGTTGRGDSPGRAHYLLTRFNIVDKGLSRTDINILTAENLIELTEGWLGTAGK